MSSIRAVILDYGNVLCVWPGAEEFEALYRLSGIPPEKFQECFWRYRRDYDRGTLDGPAYWRKVARDAAVAFTNGQIEQLIAADVRLWQHRDPTLTRWVEALRATGVKTALLSNMPRDIARSLRQAPSWLEKFDSVVLSSETGFLKPEPEIYRVCLRQLRVKMDEALFIDDRAENVVGAQALGLHALRFESSRQLAGELEPFGLPGLELEAA